MFLEVVDNLIPQHLQDFYELSTLGQASNGTAMHPIVDFKCKYENTAIEKSFAPLSFVHLLKSSNTISSHLPNFGLIPQLVCSEFNLRLKEIFLGRIFIVMPYETELKYYEPHTDLPFPHTVVLYYVNDADGDTVLFNNDGDIIKTVSPKKGRVLVFDGSIKHSGGIPKNGPRCAINFDIIL
jgi:hypothetical protein